MSRKGNRGKQDFIRKLQKTEVERYAEDVVVEITKSPDRKAAWDDMIGAMQEYGYDTDEMMIDLAKLSMGERHSVETAAKVIATVVITTSRINIAQIQADLELADKQLESMHDLFSLFVAEPSPDNPEVTEQ